MGPISAEQARGVHKAAVVRDYISQPRLGEQFLLLLYAQFV